MEFSQPLLASWQEYYLSQASASHSAEIHSNALFALNEQEVRSGQLSQEKLHSYPAFKTSSQSVLIAPFSAQKRTTQGTDVIYPIWYSVILTSEGKILSKPNHMLPWVPRSFLDPCDDATVILGQFYQYQQYFQLHPPTWATAPDKATWAYQLSYAYAVLEGISDGAWKSHLQVAGYELCANGYLRILEDVLAESKDVYQNARLSNFKVNETLGATKTYYGHVNQDFCLSQQQAHALRQALALKKHQGLNIQICKRGGQTTLIQNAVANIWVDAVIQQSKPPNIWYHSNHIKAKLVTLFDLPVEGILNTQTIKSLFEPSQLDWQRHHENINLFIEGFTQKYPLEFTGMAPDLYQIKVWLHQAILKKKNYIDNKLEIQAQSERCVYQIQKQYHNFGGIKVRAQQLKNKLVYLRGERRYLLTLQAIVKRELKALGINRWLAFLDEKASRRLQQIKVLLNAYALKDNHVVNNFADLKECLGFLVKQNHHRLRVHEDAILQVQINQNQLQTHDKLVKKNNLQYLDYSLRYEILELCTHYWTVKALLEPGASFMSEDNYAIVRHAEHFSPLYWPWLLQKYDRILVMSGTNVGQSTIFQDEGQFTDKEKSLMLNSGSIGCSAHYFFKTLTLNESWNINPQIFRASELINGESTLKNLSQPCPTGLLMPLMWSPCDEASVPFMGSRVNMHQAKQLITWLKSAIETLKHYYHKPLNDIVCIYTPYLAQKQIMSSMLEKHNIFDLKIWVDVPANARRYPIVLFMPVINLKEAEQVAQSLQKQVADERYKKLFDLAVQSVLIMGEYIPSQSKEFNQYWQQEASVLNWPPQLKKQTASETHAAAMID